MAAIHGRFTRSQILIQNGISDSDSSAFTPVEQLSFTSL